MDKKLVRFSLTDGIRSVAPVNGRTVYDVARELLAKTR